MPRSTRPGRGVRLGPGFFDRRTTRVARELLGAELWVAQGARRRSIRIVETEAYIARDEANHANLGMTRRNRSMFGPPGTLYVYRIHQVVCANLVTRPGQAVLIRSGEPIGHLHGPTHGPGRLCRTLGITIEDDGADAVRGRRVGVRAAPERGFAVWVGPRVGVSNARDRPLRFAVIDSPFLSSPRPTRAARRFTSASPSRSCGDAPSRQIRTTRRPPSGGGRNGGHTYGT